MFIMFWSVVCGLNWKYWWSVFIFKWGWWLCLLGVLDVDLVYWVGCWWSVLVYDVDYGICSGLFDEFVVGLWVFRRINLFVLVLINME